MTLKINKLNAGAGNFRDELQRALAWENLSDAGVAARVEEILADVLQIVSGVITNDRNSNRGSTPMTMARHLASRLPLSIVLACMFPAARQPILRQY